MHHTIIIPGVAWQDHLTFVSDALGYFNGFYIVIYILKYKSIAIHVTGRGGL
jgi:hypothetical protein